MSADSTTVRDVALRPAWPPVEVVEREETRREVATLAGVLGLVTLVASIVAPVPVGLTLIVATMTTLGYWALFPFMYGGEA